MSTAISKESPNTHGFGACDIGNSPVNSPTQPQTPPAGGFGENDKATPPPPKDGGSSGFAFGDLTLTNIASALGVEQTQRTMAYQANIVSQESLLQEHLANILGGAGGPSAPGTSGSSHVPSGGLYGLELNAQINSADTAASALDDSAEGLRNAGYVGIASTGICVIGIGRTVGNVRPDGELNTELENAEAFQKRLNAEPSEEDSPLAGAREGDRVLTTGDTAAREGATEATTRQEDEEKNLIRTWKGTADRDYNVSSYKKGSTPQEASLNERAIRRLNADDREIVKNNVNEKVSQLKQKIRMKMSEQLNILTNIVGQAGNSGSNFAQAAGQSAQATDTKTSQTDSAEAQYFDKMLQSYDAQLRQAQQLANSYSSEASSTAQQMAFQG